MSPKPRKDDFETYWAYRQARKRWLKQHGGRIWTTALLVIAVGVLTRSAVAFIVVAMVAGAATVWARGRK